MLISLSLFCSVGFLEDAIKTAGNCLFALSCISSGTPMAYSGGLPQANCILEGSLSESPLGAPTPASVAAWSNHMSTEGRKALAARVTCISHVWGEWQQ